MRIPAKGKEFVNYNSKDKEGHLPYLYDAGFERIRKMKFNICDDTIKKINTVQMKLLGLSKLSSDRSESSSRRHQEYQHLNFDRHGIDVFLETILI